jgi:hypothetical protein
MVDALVTDEDRDDGGDGRGNDGGGGDSGDGNRTKFILSQLIGDVIKKTSQARTTSGSLRGRCRPLLRGRRTMGSCHGGYRASWGANS